MNKEFLYTLLDSMSVSGNEIELQRGKSLIVVFPDDDKNEREVSYK